MAVADVASARPPTPDECEHPQPVIGVMAREFAHYAGAIGPEGTRRTSTFYGPVVGGLPIRAWHCEQCGLLRLSFPDGRSEERRLFPGPQPGLLALPTPVAAEHERYGMQARVSGLSATPAFIQQLAGEQGLVAAPLQLPTITLPDWDGVTWVTVGGLVSLLGGLLIAGLLAVLPFSTPSAEGPLVLVLTLIFVLLLLFRLAVAAIRHFVPAEPLSPSVAVTMRGTPQLDGTTRTVVGLLVLCLLGLFASAVLAVYWYATPGAEWPVVLASFACAITALVLKLIEVTVRHFRGR